MFGVAAGCLSYFVRARTDARLVVQRPAPMSAVEACTLPTTWCTVHEVLRRSSLHSRRVQLLQAAVGGVGLVCIEYARWLGVRVIASAGQVGKHQVLNSLSVDVRISSRDAAAFAFGATLCARGARMQSTCNSLIGDFVPVAMAALSEHGSVQEIGKRAAWSELRFGASEGVRCLSTIDLASDVAHSLDWYYTLLNELAARIACCLASGLPTADFDLSTVRAAFKHLMSGHSIGKVVVCSSAESILHAKLARSQPTLPSSSAVGRMTPESASLGVTEVIELAQRVAGGQIDADAPLMEAGVDSLGAVELRNQLQDAMGEGVGLSSTLVFDHPTARLLASLFQSAPSAVRTGAALLVRSAAADGGGVVVDGSSALLPAGPASMRATCRMVACGHNGVVEVPTARWHVDAQAALPEPLASRARHGGFLRGTELADCAAFAISPVEAVAVDPCQRLVLEHGYAALHGARLDRLVFGGSLTGVFLGFSGSEFSKILALSPAGSSVYAATGSAASIACGRVSYVLGLHGPCATYDTACSAALVACHAGLRALQLDECPAGLVAGVTLMLLPGVGLSFALAGMTSARGRSQTFDARADGYARAEACGGVALRSSVDEASLCCLLGSAVRQDGRSASLTAPNGQAQQHLLMAALCHAGTVADALALGEAHGTGTALGDPIEAGSLAAAVLVAREEAPLIVGSVKANIGHAEPAAGMTGLLKLALALCSGEAAPNAQLRAVNLHVSGVVRHTKCGLPTHPAMLALASQRGGASSFGYAGTIANVLLSCASAPNVVDGRSLALPLMYRRRTFMMGAAVCPAEGATAHKAITVDVPLMQAGLTSVGAIRLASALCRDCGIDVQTTVVFEFHTARSIAAHLQASGASASPQSVLTATKEVLASVGGASAVATAISPPLSTQLDGVRRSTGPGVDDTFVSVGLTCLRPASAGTSLVCIPNNGHANGYKPLASVVDNAIYAAIHPHLQTGSNLHLQAATLEELCGAWALAILHEVALPVNFADFCLIGTSMGGLFAHQTALSASRHGCPPQLLFLVEPRPPIRPLSVPMQRGLHAAALFVGALISVDNSFEIDVSDDDADLGCQLAAFAADLGLAAFTPAAVRDRQRELRATTHMIDLAAMFTAQEDGTADDIDCKVCLSTASEREDFFMNVCHLTLAESEAATARLYGDVVEELTLSGTHMDVCARCVTGDVDAFNALLRRRLCNASDSALPGVNAEPTALIDHDGAWHGLGLL